ncbi:MAG: hypothetical protein AAB492_01500 [Patescibacteria group bacterium]
MNTAVINIKTDPKVKKDVQKAAAQLGFSVSALLNGYLRHFLKTKSVHFSLNEEPSEYLLKTLRESEEDRLAGRVVSFDNPSDELGFLDRMIVNERKRKSAGS